MAEWSMPAKTNAILADIYDVLASINSNLVAIGSRKKAKEPKLYPRPGQTKDDKKHIGSDALPVDDLRAWIDEKRRKHGRHDRSS